MRNVLSRGNSIFPGTTYPTNGDRPMLVVLTAVSDTEAQGYKVWDPGKTSFTARRLTSDRLIVGQYAAFFRLLDEYVVLARPGLIFVRDNGYGAGQECDHLGNIIPGSLALPTVPTDPLTRFHNNKPPWMAGRIYPGWCMGTHHVVLMQGFGEASKYSTSSSETSDGDLVELEFDLDSSGKVVDFRALDLLAFAAYLGVSDSVWLTEYQTGAWNAGTNLVTNSDFSHYEQQLRSLGPRAAYIHHRSSNARTAFFDGSWSSEHDLGAANSTKTFLGAALGRNWGYFKFAKNTTPACSVVPYEIATATYGTTADYAGTIETWSGVAAMGVMGNGIVACKNDKCLVYQVGAYSSAQGLISVLRANDGILEPNFVSLGYVQKSPSRGNIVGAINNSISAIVHSKRSGNYSTALEMWTARHGASWGGPYLIEALGATSNHSFACEASMSDRFLAFADTYKPSTAPASTPLKVKYFDLVSGTWASYELKADISSYAYTVKIACSGDSIHVLFWYLHNTISSDTGTKHFVFDGSWNGGASISDVSVPAPNTPAVLPDFSWHFSQSGIGCMGWHDDNNFYAKVYDGSAWGSTETICADYLDGMTSIG